MSVWQHRSLPAIALYPISLLFAFAVACRRWLYRAGVLASRRLPVPVVVIGNITVGGAGKTPLVIHLAQALIARGRCPGIISRGYRGAHGGIAEVTPASDPSKVGDEPLLLARRSGCPVMVGADRVAAARALLAAHPEVDVILSDDGLQHYRLRRDVELAVFDARGVMNGWPLPAGPLRESIGRLGEVDGIVLNGTAVLSAPTFKGPVFSMSLAGIDFVSLNDPAITWTAAELRTQPLHAVAGIGDPARFFDHLSGLGLSFTPHAFADHHAYSADDLVFGPGVILTTEKDAVKLVKLSLELPVWVLPVTAEISPDLAAFVLEKINGRPPA